jgi:16S rRNA A1518/A1519 N6-dimethyltransferase RsmA/KsgA/DIM1 with predicted DNA glycosylase/AP lyase activity
MELDQSTCKAELEANNLIPRKYHGQVFTTDPAVIGKFIETVESIYRPGTKIVEIGGGLGYLTEPLIKHFDDVDCLEIDDDLFKVLATKFCQPNTVFHSDRSGGMNKKFIQKDSGSLNNNFVQNDSELSNKNSIHSDSLASNKGKSFIENKNIIQNVVSQENNDFVEQIIGSNKIVQHKGLRLIKEDILEYKVPKQDYLLVGNIPFHLSGRLYRKFMSEIDHKPYGMVFITDRQYARTLMGQPPRCYRVSLQAQAYGDIEIIADVSPASVYPSPKVTCCVMRITHNPIPLPQNFWKVVNYHFENFPTKEVESPKTLALKDWIELVDKTE